MTAPDTPSAPTPPHPPALMIWCAARGGMRSVVEAYKRDGFLERENVRLIASYDDGGTVKRQMVLVRALAQYLWMLSTCRIGLVHCHAAMRGSFWRKGIFASIARLFGVPVVFHLHGSQMEPFYRSQPKRLQAMIRKRLEGCARVLVLSKSSHSFVSEIAPNAHVTVVPNYVDVPPRLDLAARDPNQVLFLGLVGDRKGVFDLISAFAEVHRQHPEARLVIGGNGELARARTTIAAHNLRGIVTLAGWIDGAGKEALLAGSGIYTLPSYNEGLPMSVLEAMAWALPVVTTRVGGIPELVASRSDGLLVEAGDTAALASALLELLRDTDMAHTIGTAARARIAGSYSATKVLPLLSRIYAETRRSAH